MGVGSGSESADLCLGCYLGMAGIDSRTVISFE